MLSLRSARGWGCSVKRGTVLEVFQDVNDGEVDGGLHAAVQLHRGGHGGDCVGRGGGSWRVSDCGGVGVRQRGKRGGVRAGRSARIERESTSGGVPTVLIFERSFRMTMFSLTCNCPLA